MFGFSQMDCVLLLGRSKAFNHSNLSGLKLLIRLFGYITNTSPCSLFQRHLVLGLISQIIKVSFISQ